MQIVKTKTYIKDFQKKITDDVNTKFKELGNSIAELAENQAAIFKTLDNIQERVKANEVKIAALEKRTCCSPHGRHLVSLFYSAI